MSVRLSLEQWMKQQGLKNEGVCNRLSAAGYRKTPSPRTIREIKKFRRCPGWDLCFAIEKLSKGVVDAHAFREAYETAKKKKQKRS